MPITGLKSICECGGSSASHSTTNADEPIVCVRGHNKQTVMRMVEGEEDEASAKPQSEFYKGTTIPTALVDELVPKCGF
jgi:hypothetical protein